MANAIPLPRAAVAATANRSSTSATVTAASAAVAGAVAAVSTLASAQSAAYHASHRRLFGFRTHSASGRSAIRVNAAYGSPWWSSNRASSVGRQTLTTSPKWTVDEVSVAVIASHRSRPSLSPSMPNAVAAQYAPGARLLATT